MGQRSMSTPNLGALDGLSNPRLTLEHGMFRQIHTEYEIDGGEVLGTGGYL